MQKLFTELKPMLAKTAHDIPMLGASFADAWIMEPKWDGHRLLAQKSDEGVGITLRGRMGSDKTEHLRPIAEALEVLPDHTTLDGEIVVFGDGVEQDWGKVQSLMGGNPANSQAQATAVYVVFDILEMSGSDIRHFKWEDRRELLVNLFDALNFDENGPIALCPTMPVDEDYYHALLRQGFEGAMLKRRASTYQSDRRSSDWLKWKAVEEMDVVVTGFKPGEGSFSGMVGAIEFGQYRTDASGKSFLCYRSRCSGFNMKLRRAMTACPEDYIGRVMTIRHMGIMPSGAPRHPVFDRWRDDKNALECEWEGA